jgi:FkbM family methyltransferase
MPDTVHPPVKVHLHRWSAVFEPRPGNIDMAASDVVVVSECWRQNDYRVPPGGLRGTVVDVGANVGAFSVLAAKSGAAVVHAFEPHPGNRARLEHHLAINDVAGWVVVHPEAVGEKTGDTVWIAGSGGGAHVADEGDVAVQTVSLADVLADVGPVEFLKHDAEGAEWDSFQSVTAHILHEQVRRIALEWHGPLMGPHLTHIGADGHYIERWHQLVEMLADSGRLEIRGHPTVGGLMHWARY